jgi:hypothetical protein
MRLLLVFVLLTTVLLSACAIEPEEPVDAYAHLRLEATATAAAAAGHDHPMAPLSGMPEMVQSANARTQAAYRFAIANPEAAQEVPCYCGCVGLGHTSSYDCYVAGKSANGALEYDMHAANCTVCVDITHDQMRMMDNGDPPQVIRDYLADNYAKYGPPTDDGAVQ